MLLCSKKMVSSFLASQLILTQRILFESQIILSFGCS